ncbi:MAG: ferredoxin [Bacilli bacterium]
MTKTQLLKIREQASLKLRMANIPNAYRIAIGMATCGLTAGSQPVYDEFISEVAKRNLKNVFVVSVGCVGECALEPLVEVFDNKGFTTTYCKVKPLDVERIIDSHIIQGFVLEDLLIDKYKKIGGSNEY